MMLLGYSLPRVSLSLSRIICVSAMIAALSDNAWSIKGEEVSDSLPTTVEQRQDLGKTIDFDIKRDLIGKALLSFGEQAGLSVAIRHEVVGNQSNALVGRYTITKGLELLLDGTGVAYRIGSDGIVVYKEIATLEVHAEESRNGEPREKASVLGRVVAALAIVLTGAPAVAEDANTQPPRGHVMEEVVVTATRREESTQDVALSITALGGAELERRGIENFEDYARLIPGVNLNKTSKNFSRFTVRGISGSARDGTNQQPVAVYLDELPVTVVNGGFPMTADLRLYDVERVEVLRGPQGTLFGSGSLSGAVRMVTRKADLTGFDAAIRTDLGWTGSDSRRQRINGMINVPLIDQELAVRLVGYWVDEDGTVDNIGTGIDNADANEEQGGRVSMRWQPNDRFSSTFMALQEDSEPQDFSLIDPALGDRVRSSFIPANGYSKLTSYNLTLEYAFDWATLTSSTTRASQDGRFGFDITKSINFFPVAISNPLDVSALTQELRLVSAPSDRFEWVLGAFYLDREFDYVVDFPTDPDFVAGLNITGLLPGNRTLLWPGQSLDQEQAVFGEVSWHLSDTVTLTVGLRYTEYEVASSSGDQYNVVGPLIGAIFAGGNQTIAPVVIPGGKLGPFKDDQLTKKVSLTWQPTAERTVYLTAADGFRMASLNANAGQASLTDPTDILVPDGADADSLWSYELGYKSLWPEIGFKLNAAVYYMKWSDIQVNANRASDSVNFLTNAGEAVSKGLEFEMQYWPTESLELGLSANFQNAEITSISQLESAISGAVKGQQLVGPDRQYAAFAQYTRGVGNGYKGYLRVDAQWIDSYPNGFANVPGQLGVPNPVIQDTDAYENVNLSLGLETDRWTVTLYGENILNNDDYTYIDPRVAIANKYGTLRPRTVGVRVNWRHH